MITWLMARLSKLPLNYPKAVIAFSLFITAIAAFALPNLYVSTDRNLLAGKDNPTFRQRERVNDLFGTSLVSVVVISGNEDPAEVRRAADALAAALTKHPDHIRDVFYKADIAFFERHALLFLPIENLSEQPDALELSKNAANLIAEVDGLPALVTGLADLLSEVKAPEDTSPEDTAAALGFFGEVFDELENWFTGEEIKELSIEDKLWSAGPSMTSQPGHDGYLTDKDGATPPLAVMFVQPTSNSQAMEVVAPLTELIRNETAEVLRRFPGVTAKVTGMPAIVTDEMHAVTRDCVVAGFASGLGVLIIFMFAFRSVRMSLFLCLPLGLGLVWSAGLTAVLYGHLTMITSYFAAVLFGLGVAFTIHIVSRFHEAISDGEEKKEAIKTALTGAGPGVVAGGGTTALAFLAIAFSEFKGFAEMGVISGLGVTLILIANLTLLPASLLLWHPGKELVERQKKRGAFWVRIARSRIVVPLLALAAMVAGAILIPKLNFDYAVENLLPANADSVIGMRTIEDRTDFSMNYSIALTDSLEASEALRQRYLTLSTVGRAESLSMFVPMDQKKKLAALAKIDEALREPVKRAVAALSAGKDQLGRVTAASFAAALEEFSDTLEDMAFDAKRAGRAEAEPLKKLVIKVRKAQQAVLASGNDERARALEKLLFANLSRGVNLLEKALDEKGFGPDDLPTAVLGRYRSQDKKHYAVIVFPNDDIGKRAFFEKHVAELLSVNPETTGHPVTHLDFTHMVLRGFTDAIILSAIAVVLLILLDLRSPKGLALALLPVLMGLGWTVLIMVAFDFKFNYANLMALPILIGTGVDYGVHLAHRAKQEGSIYKAARTTGRAIALCGLTTLVGFGSLILGNHWGVRSLGIVLVIGISACLVAALVVIPGLVRAKTDPGQDKT
jgi:hopanoid biosynthesis associated RND transporter like protein HpnN